MKKDAHSSAGSKYEHHYADENKVSNPKSIHSYGDGDGDGGAKKIACCGCGASSRVYRVKIDPDQQTLEGEHF